MQGHQTIKNNVVSTFSVLAVRLDKTRPTLGTDDMVSVRIVLVAQGGTKRIRLIKAPSFSSAFFFCRVLGQR